MGKKKRSGKQGDPANSMEGEQNSLVDFTSESSLHQFPFLMVCTGDSILGAVKRRKKIADTYDEKLTSNDLCLNN